MAIAVASTSRSRPPMLTALWWAVLAVVAGSTVILLPTWVVDWNWDIWRLHSDPLYPKYQLWVFSLAVQVLWWIVCLPLMAREFRRLHNLYPLSSRRLFQLALATLCFYAIFELRTQVSHQRPTLLFQGVTTVSIRHLPAFSVFGTVIAFIAAFGVLWTWYGLLKFHIDDRTAISRLLRLRSTLELFLLVATMILCGGVLAMALLRRAVNNEDIRHPVSSEYVLIYGAMYSCVLLLLYGAARFQFVQVGQRLVSLAVGEVPGEETTLLKWLEERQKLISALGLELSGLNSVGGLLATTLPFALSAVSIVLKSN